jgi:hypothetical protein
MKRTLAVAATLALALSAPALARSVLFQGAITGAHARPAMLWLSVDGTLEASHMHWRSWGGAVAIGTGRVEWHGCTPNCGTDRAHEANGSAHLSQIHICEGRSYYSKVSVYVQDRGRERLLYGLSVNYAPC